MTDDYRKYWFWINNIKGIGNNKIRKLLTDFSYEPEAVYNADFIEISSRTYLADEDVVNILDTSLRKSIFDKYDEYTQKGLKFIFPVEEAYPYRLQELYDKPYILYYNGKMPPQDKISVAVVGSRQCSEYGRSVAREIGRQLAMHDVNVISGLALGIDCEAHRGAVLAGGRTYGVLAGSAYKCYPPQNYNLYMDMLKNGGIISEYGPDTHTVPGLFPVRNRIICGLCDAVIVVEAGQKSGSLITVSRALDQNRQVYAVPGRIGDPVSYGCNDLISQGAMIITSYDRLLEDLGIKLNKESEYDSEIKNNLTLATEEKLLYSLLLDFTPRGLETLIAESGLSAGSVLNSLLSLELKGYIRETSKNYYVRI